MASRPSWDGFLRFSLIAVPVKAYNAAAPAHGKVSFHMLHATCHNRIRYQKVCPVHGPVPDDEIVSGYEESKGHYVIVEKEERKGARLEADKAVSIDTFVPETAIDPAYFSGRTYYLVPDGQVAQKAYAVLHDAMKDRGVCAISQAVFSGRGHVAAIRPRGDVLAMTLLSYANEIKTPNEFEAQVGKPDVTTEERRLAGTLIEASTSEDFDMSKYTDEYTDRLAKLVNGKGKRRKVVAPDAESEPEVINLMDALKRSLHQSPKGKKEKARGSSKRPARRKTG